MSCGNGKLLSILEDYVDEAVGFLREAEGLGELTTPNRFALRALEQGLQRLEEARGRLKHAMD